MTMTQLFPAVVDPKTLSRQVWGVESARSIPGVGRALSLYGGLIGQMPLDDYRGVVPLPRPRLLAQPDLELDRPTFVSAQVEDYLLHGNAACLVTARGVDGWPAAVRYYPAHRWHQGPESGPVAWYLDGRPVDEHDVVHVQRGVDPMFPRRGMGVVEQHIRSLDRAALQEESEREALTNGQVPSVAVITPQVEPEEGDLDAAAEKWEEKFRGPGRRPGFFPKDTQVIPLSWSPNDQQATLARQLTLTDVSNCFNLDSYWLGAPGGSHTYKSAGPLFLIMLRTALNGVIGPFEGVWSQSWLPYGREVRFDRQAVLADDLNTMVNTLTKATGRPVMTVDEARTRHLGMVALGGDAAELHTKPAAPADNPDDDEDQDQDEDKDES
jgi:portal protein